MTCSSGKKERSQRITHAGAGENQREEMTALESRINADIRQKQLLKLDVLLDDCVDNLVGDISYIPLCMGYPWNENDERVGHVYSWIEAYNCIHYIIEDRERE